MSKCLICGKELSLDETQFIIYLGEFGTFSYCLSHEGTELEKRLQPLIESASKLYKQNETYKKRLGNIICNLDMENKKLKQAIKELENK